MDEVVGGIKGVKLNNQYEGVLELSAIKYVAQLEQAIQGNVITDNEVFQNLITSYRLAIEKKSMLSADDVQFSQDVLRSTTLQDREHLINQYSLGLGSPDAPVIFVGTEHAYEMEHTIPLSLEAIGLSILWLCNGNADTTSKLLGAPWQYPVPFHIHPNALYRVHQTTRGQHTWKVLSSIMAPVLNIKNYRRLLSDYTPGLGNVAYQIEMSAFPSKQATGGKLPSKERLEFLAQLFTAMRETTKVLVFHGKPSDKLWNKNRNMLSRKFLNLSSEAEMEFSSIKVEKAHIRYSTPRTHRVIYTRALNGSVSNVYRKQVSNLISECLS